MGDASDVPCKGLGHLFRTAFGFCSAKSSASSHLRFVRSGSLEKWDHVDVEEGAVALNG